MARKKILASLTALALLAGCSKTRRIVVGSKNFTEQLVLGEIVAQQVERRLRVKVERRLNLGGTLLAHQSLVHGEIDLYPEYTGTALTNVLKLPASADTKAVRQRVSEEYRRRWRIEWLPPLGFNNTFAMVIAPGAGLETLTEAAARKSGWRLGVGYEFLRREDGLPGLLQTYHLPLDGSPRSMDLGLLYQALKQNQVDMVAGNATDGVIAALGLKVLRDDKGYFPPYEAAIAVREAALAANPGLLEALLELSGRFSDAEMRSLNHQVDGEHRPIAEVARAWLNQQR